MSFGMPKLDLNVPPTMYMDIPMPSPAYPRNIFSVLKSKKIQEDACKVAEVLDADDLTTDVEYLIYNIIAWTTVYHNDRIIVKGEQDKGYYIKKKDMIEGLIYSQSDSSFRGFTTAARKEIYNVFFRILEVYGDDESLIDISKIEVLVIIKDTLNGFDIGLENDLVEYGIDVGGEFDAGSDYKYAYLYPSIDFIRTIGIKDFTLREFVRILCDTHGKNDHDIEVCAQAAIIISFIRARNDPDVRIRVSHPLCWTGLEERIPEGEEFISEELIKIGHCRKKD